MLYDHECHDLVYFPPCYVWDSRNIDLKNSPKYIPERKSSLAVVSKDIERVSQEPITLYNLPLSISMFIYYVNVLSTKIG